MACAFGQHILGNHGFAGAAASNPRITFPILVRLSIFGMTINSSLNVAGSSTRVCTAVPSAELAVGSGAVRQEYCRCAGVLDQIFRRWNCSQSCRGRPRCSGRGTSRLR